jgi:hypothetical protein
MSVILPFRWLRLLSVIVTARFVRNVFHKIANVCRGEKYAELRNRLTTNQEKVMRSESLLGLSD